MVVLIVIVNCPTCNSRQYHTEIQIHEYKIHQANLVPVQGEGDDRSLTDTLPEDSVSVTGSEMNTPNTIRKGEICLLFCSVKKMNTLKSELFLLFFSGWNRWMIWTQSEKLSSFPQFELRGFGCLRCWRFAGITETPQVYTHGDPLRPNWPDFS